MRAGEGLAEVTEDRRRAQETATEAAVIALAIGAPAVARRAFVAAREAMRRGSAAAVPSGARKPVEG